MQLWRERAGDGIHLDDEPLGRGGEASIFAIADQQLVAKVYHQPSPERAAKLEAMLRDPPVNPPPADHVSIAWPIDRLLDEEEKVVGYLMPRVRGARSIHEFYNPALRLKNCPLFHYGYLVRTARNLATAIWALHERRYVVGDLNESNLLVTTRALVTLVDADSIQVPSATGGVFPCPVGRSDYTPPELQEAVFAQVERQPEHDGFALGVLIFQLLMGGTHPFAGVYDGAGEPPGIAQRIAAGHWPYCRARKVPYRAAPHAPSWATLPLPVQELMWACFEEGHAKPKQRPSAARWQAALKESEDALVTCKRNSQHLFQRGLAECPWCQLVEKRGRDPFPPAARPAKPANPEASGAMATMPAPEAKKTQTLEAPPVRARRVPAAAAPAAADLFELQPPRTHSPIVELAHAVLRTSWRLLLTAMLIGGAVGLVYLAWAYWPGPTLDRRYLPDGSRSIYSVRPSKLIGTAAYQDLQTRVPELVNPLERLIAERFGVPPAAIERLTVARDGQGDVAVTIHARTDLSIEAMGKMRSDSPVYQKLRFQSLAFGNYELHEESYEMTPGKRVNGWVFCTPQPRLLIAGKRALIEKILERGGDARLEAPLARVVAETDFNRPLAWASLRLGPLPAGIVPLDLDKVEASGASLAVGDTVEARALLLFSDEPAAAKLRSAVILGIIDWKRQLYMEGKVPAEAVRLLDSLEVGHSGTLVKLTTTDEANDVVQALKLLWHAREPRR